VAFKRSAVPLAFARFANSRLRALAFAVYGWRAVRAGNVLNAPL